MFGKHQSVRHREVFGNVQTTVYDRAGMTALLSVEEGQSLFFLVDGYRPIPGPPEGQGDFAIPTDSLRGNADLPVLAIIVPSDHREDWLAVDEVGVARMVANARRQAAAIRETGARVQ